MMEQTYIYSGRPLPKADLLEEVLSNYLNTSDNTGSLVRYLQGDYDFGDPANMDITILDADNAFKMIGAIKDKYQGWFRRTKSEALNKNPILVAKALDFMKQSIYATRYRLQETKRFRKRYSPDIRYNLAIFYGALMQINFKMEALFTIMKKLPTYTHFMWYLLIYEKILAAHVDIHMMVERIYDLHFKQKAKDRGVKVVIAPTIPPDGITHPKKRGPRKTTIKHVIHDLEDYGTVNQTIDVPLPEMTTDEGPPPTTTTTTTTTTEPPTKADELETTLAQKSTVASDSEEEQRTEPPTDDPDSTNY
jgi:hypothetical protein